MKTKTCYRIRKETKGYYTKYYPQRRFLGIWWDMFRWNPYYDGFYQFEDAQRELNQTLMKSEVEYLDIN